MILHMSTARHWHGPHRCLDIPQLHEEITEKYSDLLGPLPLKLPPFCEVSHAVMQEPDNTLNLLDIDFWLWYQKVTLKGMACAFKIKFWEMFSTVGNKTIRMFGSFVL